MSEQGSVLEGVCKGNTGATERDKATTCEASTRNHVNTRPQHDTLNEVGIIIMVTVC